MSNYLDTGFSPYFEYDYGPSSELSGIDQDALFSEISGSKILGGVLTSTDNKTSYNLNEGLFKVSDGVIDRVLLGKLSDGEYGLRIVDRDGNILVDITGDKNILQSPSKRFQIDLSEEQLRVFDALNLRVLLGLLR